MDSADIFPILSFFIILIALGYGAWCDVKCRKAPKWIWTICTPFCLFTTTIWYIILYMKGIEAFLSVFVISIILCPFCWVMSYRMGNGGDWRAFFYISLFTPWLAPATLLGAGFIGLVQCLIDHLRKSPIDSAWMVSITLAYIVSESLYISTFH